MNKTLFTSMYQYNYWAHRKVWGCVMELSEEDYRQPLDYSIGSIESQVIHTMLVEESYFRFLTDNVMGMRNEADYPTRESVRQA